MTEAELVEIVRILLKTVAERDKQIMRLDADAARRQAEVAVFRQARPS